MRDRLLMHAITEAYRNVIPPTSFPVALLFLELPAGEVDVNVHPAKTEVRFRQQSVIHDFVRDSLRTALIKARPAAGFLAALDSAPSASPSLMPPAASPLPGSPDGAALLRNSEPADSMTVLADAETFRLTPAQAGGGSGEAAVFARGVWSRCAGQPAGMGRGGGGASATSRASRSYRMFAKSRIC